MEKYEAIKYLVWVRDDGLTASIFSACPWGFNDSQKERWKIEQRGWTIRNNVTGTTGLGQKPFDTQEEAQAKIDQLNKEYEERVLKLQSTNK